VSMCTVEYCTLQQFLNIPQEGMTATAHGLHDPNMVVPPCIQTNATVSPSPGSRAMSAEQPMLEISGGPTDLHC